MLKYKYILLMVSLCCIQWPLFAQTNQGTQLTLDITSNEFADGIAPGEHGKLNINITNDGPNDHSSEDTLSIWIGHNYTQDINIFAEFLISSTDDPNCQIHIPHIDPRPPVNNIVYMHFFTVVANINVGETFTCGIDITFSEPGLMETIWQFSYLTPNGLVIDEVPFVFRGQAVVVPINLTGYLVIGVLLLGGVFLRKQVNKDVD